MKTGTFRKTPARPLLRSLGAPMDKAQATSPRLLVFPLSNMRPPWNIEGTPASSLCHKLLDGPGQKKTGVKISNFRERERSGEAKTHGDIAGQRAGGNLSLLHWTKSRKKPWNQN